MVSRAVRVDVPINDSALDDLSKNVCIDLDAIDGLAVDTLLARINEQLAWIESAHGLDVDDEQPLVHPGDPINSMRDDEIEPPLGADLALENAPVHDQDFFLVPRVVDDNT